MTTYLAIHFARGLVALGLAMGVDTDEPLSFRIGFMMVIVGPLSLGVNLGLIAQALMEDEDEDEDDANDASVTNANPTLSKPAEMKQPML